DSLEGSGLGDSPEVVMLNEKGEDLKSGDESCAWVPAAVSEDGGLEEKLQPTTLLQGINQVVTALTGIRQAIEVQAEDVGRSIDAFLCLAVNLRKNEMTDDLFVEEELDEDGPVGFAWDCSALPEQ
ncbi:unnamed protein product, partial [Effrenium voratum]